MEICRFVYEGISYRAGSRIDEIGDLKIPSPYFEVTSRSSKKNRSELPSDKDDRHYNRIPIKNPIGFYRKIYSIYAEFLKDWNYVAFVAHKDDQEKRLRLYHQAVLKMGFEKAYTYVCPWDKSYIEHFYARPGYILKKKQIKKLIKAAYGNWVWNGEEWVDDI